MVMAYKILERAAKLPGNVKEQVLFKAIVAAGGEVCSECAGYGGCAHIVAEGQVLELTRRQEKFTLSEPYTEDSLGWCMCLSCGAKGYTLPSSAS